MRQALHNARLHATPDALVERAHRTGAAWRTATRKRRHCTRSTTLARYGFALRQFFVTLNDILYMAFPYATHTTLPSLHNSPPTPPPLPLPCPRTATLGRGCLPPCTGDHWDRQDGLFGMVVVEPGHASHHHYLFETHAHTTPTTHSSANSWRASGRASPPHHHPSCARGH